MSGERSGLRISFEIDPKLLADCGESHFRVEA